MQQTENYKLNLIETSDSFSPQALNENAEKVEAALAALDGADAALSQRVQVLELKKLVAGTYTGDGTASKIIDLGFTPAAVFVRRIEYSYHCDSLAIAGQGVVYKGNPYLSIVENGFQVFSFTENNPNAMVPYNYIAFG